MRFLSIARAPSAADASGSGYRTVLLGLKGLRRRCAAPGPIRRARRRPSAPGGPSACARAPGPPPPARGAPAGSPSRTAPPRRRRARPRCGCVSWCGGNSRGVLGIEGPAGRETDARWIVVAVREIAGVPAMVAARPGRLFSGLMVALSCSDHLRAVGTARSSAKCASRRPGCSGAGRRCPRDRRVTAEIVT